MAAGAFRRHVAPVAAHVAAEAMVGLVVGVGQGGVAIAVVVELGGAGANTQFMARQVMDAYINIRSYSDTSEETMTLLK